MQKLHRGFLSGAALLLLLFTATSSVLAKGPNLIVYGDYVVTIDPAQPLLRDAAVVVADDRIVAVGPRAEIDRQYVASKTISGSGRVLMPGLINGHTHTSMTLFRGMVDDLKLMTWLNNYVFPMEGRFVTPAFAPHAPNECGPVRALPNKPAGIDRIGA